jgi:aminobenzoyl-glutamate transport protein
MSQHQDPAPSEGPEPFLGPAFLDFVEWLGNLLPHPVTLFAIFCVAVILGSGVASWLGLEVADSATAGARGRSPDGDDQRS